MSQFYKTRNCTTHKIKAQDDQIMIDFTIFYFKNIFKIFHVVNERNERAWSVKQIMNQYCKMKNTSIDAKQCDSLICWFVFYFWPFLPLHPRTAVQPGDRPAEISPTFSSAKPQGSSWKVSSYCLLALPFDLQNWTCRLYVQFRADPRGLFLNDRCAQSSVLRRYPAHQTKPTLIKSSMKSKELNYYSTAINPLISTGVTL